LSLNLGILPPKTPSSKKKSLFQNCH